MWYHTDARSLTPVAAAPGSCGKRLLDYDIDLAPAGDVESAAVLRSIAAEDEGPLATKSAISQKLTADRLKRPSFSAATARSRLRLPSDSSSVANQIAACVSSSSTT